MRMVTLDRTQAQASGLAATLVVPVDQLQVDLVDRVGLTKLKMRSAGTLESSEVSMKKLARPSSADL